MKKPVLVLLFFVGLVLTAEASEKPKSIGIKVGPSFASARLDKGEPMTSLDLGFDFDLLWHGKRFSYGLGARKRKLTSPVGQLSEAGVVFDWGYYSNKDKSKKFGWHALLGLGSSVVSGFQKGYSSAPLSGIAELDAGLDYLIYTDKLFSNSRPEALALTLDFKVHGFNQYVSDSVLKVVKTLDYTASEVMLGLTWFW